MTQTQNTVRFYQGSKMISEDLTHLNIPEHYIQYFLFKKYLDRKTNEPFWAEMILNGVQTRYRFDIKTGLTEIAENHYAHIKYSFRLKRKHRGLYVMSQDEITITISNPKICNYGLGTNAWQLLIENDKDGQLYNFWFTTKSEAVKEAIKWMAYNVYYIK